MNTPEQLAIGLDIGGTKMAFAVTDQSGVIHEEIVLPTLAENPYDVTINRIAIQINNYLARYPQIAGIGIGVPGPVDSATGVALNAVNLSWQNRALKTDLLRCLNREVAIYVENDVNVGAISEHLFGNGSDTDNFIYISIGTGLGGATISGGQLMRGTASAEMEIGHISLDPENGLPCTCGLRGCVEMSISGKGFMATAQAHFNDFPDTQLSLDNLSTYEIIRYAHIGDPLADYIIDKAAYVLGITCAWCTIIFNPGLIILGGGFSHATYDLLQDRVLETMKARCLPQSYDSVSVMLSKLSNAALGASALVWHSQKES
ncbi:MAG: ROK family protein [Aggregatilineales bacterium]